MNGWSSRFEEYQAKSAGGCPEAALKMAMIHLYGMGCDVKRDEDKAQQFLERAAESKLPEAKSQLALFLWLKEDPRGDDLLPHAISAPSAKLWYGVILYNGMGVEEDRDRGMELMIDGFEELTEKAQSGDPIAQFDLGRFHLSMFPLSPLCRESMGIHWLIKSALQGNIRALEMIKYEITQFDLDGVMVPVLKPDDPEGNTYVPRCGGKALGRFRFKEDAFEAIVDHFEFNIIPSQLLGEAFIERVLCDLGRLRDLRISMCHLANWIKDQFPSSPVTGSHNIEVATETGPGKRKCLACGTSLHLIGRERKNGTQRHSDWMSRSHHKQCWTGELLRPAKRRRIAGLRMRD